MAAQAMPIRASLLMRCPSAGHSINIPLRHLALLSYTAYPVQSRDFVAFAFSDTRHESHTHQEVRSTASPRSKH
eukprot:5395436-Pleurochrysis_carterae.AAC.4